MNGPKFTNDFGKGIHNHVHGVVTYTPDLDITKTIEKDALLHTDNLMTRQSFQGRFVKTSRGDRKGKPGRSFEHAEALLDNQLIDEVKTDLLEAGAKADVIVETESRQPEIFVGDEPTPSGIVI
jgi:hypothetical protein